MTGPSFRYQASNCCHPNVDRLAREGIVFSRAHATAPVCPRSVRSHRGMYQRVSMHTIIAPGVNLKPLPEGAHDSNFSRKRDISQPTVMQLSRDAQEDYNFDYESAGV